jgi:arylsulfatase A-like enzyme
MYRSTLGVPWIVRGPGVAAGAVVDGLASGEDVAPTLLGLLGAPFAATGRDWSAQVRGGGRTDRDRAYAMSMFGEADVASVWTEQRVCQRDYGSLESPMPDGCFDRAADPDAVSPFDDAALQAELDAWRTARLAEGSAHAPATAVPGEDTLEQLRELGYLE